MSLSGDCQPSATKDSTSGSAAAGGAIFRVEIKYRLSFTAKKKS